jgi:hypothetical protein
VEGRTKLRREAVAATDEQLDLAAKGRPDRRVDQSIGESVGNPEASTGRLGSVELLGDVDGPLK